MFSAHMDTVRPGIGKKMFLNEATGKIESGKDTILGADDVTGLVEILEAVRHLQEEKIPYRDIEVIFPIAEELYIKGTDAFDFSQVKAKEAYVLDMGGAPGAAALRAPSLISFTVNMHGKASHAGFAPEQGIPCHPSSQSCHQPDQAGTCGRRFHAEHRKDFRWRGN